MSPVNLPDGKEAAASSERTIGERPLVAAISVVFLGFLAYSSTFGNAFVFDDYPEIVGNRAIRNLRDFLGPEGYRYNPRRYVAYLSFALNYRFGGLDVTGYHLVNLAVHIVNALLVYALLLLTFETPRMKGSVSSASSRRTAWLAALLFVVHPVQTEAVTYVVQRITSLMSTFYLASLVVYAKWKALQHTAHPSPRAGIRIGLFVALLVCMILAMKTKESAFTLPAMVLIFDGYFYGGTIRKAPLCLAFVLATFCVVPLSVVNVGKPLGEILAGAGAATSQQATATRWEYLFTQFSVIVTYIRLILLPAGQNLDYDYPVSRSLLESRTLASGLLLAMLAATAWLAVRRGRRGGDGRAWIVSFGIVWFFVALSVESSVIPITDVIFEHRLYLASVGAFAGLSAALGMARERWLGEKGLRWVPALAVVVLGALAVATYERNGVWKSRLTLWSDVVRKSPEKARGYTNLGAALFDAGRREEGIAALEKAVLLAPDFAVAHNNLGAALADSGRREEGIAALERAVLLEPEYPEAHNNLGAALVDSGRREEGIAELEKAIAVKADYAEAYYNLGRTYLDDRDKAGEAISLLTRAILLKPDYTDAYVNLGGAYNRAGRFRDAAAILGDVVRRHPDRADARFNLGVSYTFLGEERHAAEELAVLEAMNPGLAEDLRRLMSARGARAR